MALKTCRCCCATIGLEKAAKVIGIMFTILGAISIVTWAVKRDQFDEDQVGVYLIDLVGHVYVHSMVKHFNKMLVARLCMSILFTLFSAILVAGVYRGSKRLVMTFVIFFALYLGFVTIATFYSFYDPTVYIDQGSIIELQKQSADTANAVIYISLVVVLLVIAFFWYLTAVVYSYYKEMAGAGRKQEERTQEGSQMV